MGGKGIPLGRIFGIAFCINPSWLIIFIFTTWSLAGGYFSSIYPDWSPVVKISAGVITSLLFFASVLVHELMHSVVALRQGVAVKSITLFIFGGIAEITEEPKKASHEFVMALAGPAASLMLGVILIGLSLGFHGMDGVGGCIGVAASWLGWVNLSLGACNMIPGFPLDGGRVLRAVLWGRSGNLCRATRIASIVGRVMAIGIIVVGIHFILTGGWLTGVWFALMGWFLFDAAVGSYRQVQLNDLLSRHSVREAMEQICAVVPTDMHVEHLISEYASQRAQQCFAVMSGEALEGLVFCDNLRALKRKTRHKQTVAQLMLPKEKLVWVDPDDGLDKALNAMRENEMSQAPVMQDGNMIGVVNYKKLQWLIDAHSNRKQ